MKNWKKLLGMMLLAVAGTSLLAGSYDLGVWNRRRALAKKLYGRILIVDESDFYDYKVRLVDFCDAELRVYPASATYPEKDLRPGIWSIYPFRDSRVDFKVAIVEEWEDLNVHFLDSESQAGVPWHPDDPT